MHQIYRGPVLQQLIVQNKLDQKVEFCSVVWARERGWHTCESAECTRCWSKFGRTSQRLRKRVRDRFRNLRTAVNENWNSVLAGVAERQRYQDQHRIPENRLSRLSATKCLGKDLEVVSTCVAAKFSAWVSFGSGTDSSLTSGIFCSQPELSRQFVQTDWLVRRKSPATARYLWRLPGTVMHLHGEESISTSRFAESDIIFF